MEAFDIRKVMPSTAVRIDSLRRSLGTEVANDLIRRSMHGEVGCFFSMENLRTFGTPDTTATSWIGYGDDGIAYRTDPQWMIDATEFALTRGIEIERVDMSDHEEAREVAGKLRLILKEAKYA